MAVGCLFSECIVRLGVTIRMEVTFGFSGQVLRVIKRLCYKSSISL